MSGPGVTIKAVLMNALDSYMKEQKWKVAKEFYDGVSKLPENPETKEVPWFINKGSMKVLTDTLKSEPLVDWYVAFTNFYAQIEAQQAKEAKEAKEAEEANSGPKIEPVVDEPTSMKVEPKKDNIAE